MEWIREGEIFAPQARGHPDSLRSWSPWVVEEGDGALRMWYSGSDGTTSRILAASRPPGGRWERLGTAIDVGFAGDSDSYGSESPCVVKIPGGYLMVYAGFDGEISRLHMATSNDARSWHAQGTIMQRGAEDAGGANHPSLLITGERWWLFFTGYTGSSSGRGSVLVAAVSQTGASWDRLGAILEPQVDEVALSHPCVLEISRIFYLFYAIDVDASTSIALATSSDGLSWDRRGAVLEPSGHGPDGLSVQSPCVVRLRDGSLAMWYAGIPVEDQALGYRICFARFAGPGSA